MKSPTRSILGAIVAMNLLSLAAPATLRAQTPDTPGGPALDAPFGRPGIPQRILGPLFPVLRRLQLTADQRGQVRQVLMGHRDDFRALVSREVEARRPLFEAVFIDDFNEQTIRDRSAAVAAVQADAAVLRGTIRTEIFEVLTPDQRERAIELLRRFEHRRDEGADSSTPF